MSERCILAVRFTPAGNLGAVRRAVGGFLRYVQHRDLHPTQADAGDPAVRGLLKYMAYRDQASARAELFGPSGTLSSADRKALASFVVRSLEESRPQLYRNRAGEMVDRRRAVYRMVISPERASGLDLRRLASSAVGRLESEVGVAGLRWMAAIHRNTAHPHVHLVIAGMYEAADGFHRVDLTRLRVASMKEAIGLEIDRQRGERTPLAVIALPERKPIAGILTARPPMVQPAVQRRRFERPVGPHRVSIIRLRAAALAYRRHVERAASDEARRRGWEYAA